MNALEADVLIVGGGTGGTTAAIQAARRGATTILVSEFSWLGGMLTAAGVAAPDGNELAAFQTGLWGAFLQALQQRQPHGLDHGWVSFFTYEPQIGAAIFADWVQALPNLHWISGQVPLEVLTSGNRIVGVRFADYVVRSKLTIDATELGDVLALADVPYRWGWEWQSQWQEPSAPSGPNNLTQQYSVQAPTWVFVLQDFGSTDKAPAIVLDPAMPPELQSFGLQSFTQTWDGYGTEQFLNYGRLPGDRFMINWPQHGNDYGVKLDRLVESTAACTDFLQEAHWHSQHYAQFLQAQLGRRYGLAETTFPRLATGIGGGAFALHPYYRESRRVQGLVTVCEQDILPLPNGHVAELPIDASGRAEPIALGNYANDHHYPGYEFSLTAKSVRWGGRWTGTPFTLPYRCLIPATVDGLLVGEKNISVSHIANGATRLQPVVLGIGQAAGMAAALCVERGCQPRSLPVEDLQMALLHDPVAPAAIVPLFNLPPHHPDWLQWQQYYLTHPDRYPADGLCPAAVPAPTLPLSASVQTFIGVFRQQAFQSYTILLSEPIEWSGHTFCLVTLWHDINQQLQHYRTGDRLQLQGRLNRSGNWIVVEKVSLEQSQQRSSGMDRF
jgi:hypothetical protein